MNNLPLYLHCRALFFFLCLVGSIACRAQVASQDTLPQITGYHNLTREGTIFRLHDCLQIQVSQLGRFLKNKPRTNAKLILYLNEMPMAHLEASRIDTCLGEILFELKRDSGAVSLDYLYRKPLHNLFGQRLRLGIGYANHCALYSDLTITLALIDRAYFYLALVAILLFVVGIFFVAIKSNLLKNHSPLKGGAYSLSRTQLAFWVVLCASSYCFLYVATGEAPVLNASVLILLGIGAGTSAIAQIIDADHTATRELRRENAPLTNKNFLLEILTDGEGVSIHRLQMVVFTLIAGGVFLHQVWSTYALPVFDTGLLTLLGISNGTYTALKTQENKPVA